MSFLTYGFLFVSILLTRPIYRTEGIVVFDPGTLGFGFCYIDLLGFCYIDLLGFCYMDLFGFC